MTRDEKRAQIVAEARSWIGTPYHVRACVKHAGCDCSSFLMGVAVGSGMMESEELPVYKPNCWQQWTDDEYRKKVMRYAKSILAGRVRIAPVILPGSLLLVRVSNFKFHNHGGIVTRWPMIVHSVAPTVEEVDVATHPLWRGNEIEAFDFDRLLELA